MLLIGYILEEEMVLKQSNLLTVLPFIGMEFNISFDLFVAEYSTDMWANVIHFTIGENTDEYGNRNPAIFASPDKQFYLVSAINGEDYIYNHKTELEAQTWINMEISQTLLDKKARRQVRHK